MEMFLVQCSGFLSSNYPLLVSVILAGLVGSASHCSVMCSPLVAAQMLNLQENNKPQTTMIYYHAGRISTYMLLGVMAVMLSRFVFSGELQSYANALLFLAGITFIVSAISPRKTHNCCSSKTKKLQKLIEKIPFSKLVYYLRGLLMGFMPCGMVVAILLSVATLDNPIEAALTMLLFGLTTVPILQLAGFGALRLKKYYPKISAQAGRSVMALNGLFLCSLGLNLVSIN